MFGLYISSRKIYSQTNSVVVFVCKFLRNMLPFIAHTKHDFHFIMYILRKLRKIEVFIILQNGGVGFKKNNRFLRNRIVQFFGMIYVVSTYCYYFHECYLLM